MPTRICTERGCPEPAEYRGKCKPHARQREQNTPRAGRHIYNTKRWRILRRSYLAAHPYCECEHNCGQLATDIHHRKDIADGGDPYTGNNLQALAHNCHSRITRRKATQP